MPVSPLPDGLKLPSWKIQLPRGPILVENAEITIVNPELLQFLVPQPSAQ